MHGIKLVGCQLFRLSALSPSEGCILQPSVSETAAMASSPYPCKTTDGLAGVGLLATAAASGRPMCRGACSLVHLQSVQGYKQPVREPYAAAAPSSGLTCLPSPSFAAAPTPHRCR
eukprot:271317-Chlamydomonas_euryale.AAC.1